MILYICVFDRSFIKCIICVGDITSSVGCFLVLSFNESLTYTHIYVFLIYLPTYMLILALYILQVEDWRNNQKDEHNNDQNAEQQQLPYEIERIATVLAVTCMFLAALYSIFAILLFLYFGSKEHMVDDTDEINIVSMQPTGGHLHHQHHRHHPDPHCTLNSSRRRLLPSTLYPFPSAPICCCCSRISPSR